MAEPLKSKMLSAEGEPLRRYHEAMRLLRRAKTAWFREHHEEGETIQDVMSEIDDFDECENLESEIFGQAVVPVSKRATGRTIPDLTSMEHVCEWQQQVEATEAASCPHAAPHRYCQTCVETPCPIGLDTKA